MANEILIGHVNKVLAVYKEIDSLINGLACFFKRREDILAERSKTPPKRKKVKAEDLANNQNFDGDDSEFERVSRALKETYEKLVEKRQEMEELVGALPGECRSPLVLYFVREFLREEKCDTIVGGVKLYSNKYQSLVNSKDEKEIALLRQINIELAKTGQRDNFLSAVDAKVKDIF